MSDRELKAIISAQDKASPTFKTVAAGAQKMGTALDKAGDQGKVASAEIVRALQAIEKNTATTAVGVQKLGTAVESATQKGAKGFNDQGKSVVDLNTKMAALGGVAATASSVLATWSRSSQEAAAIQRQLEASIAATGEEYATYADRIQAAGARAVQLGQDDEAASQAISALTQVTGSANVALDQMGLVMDLAAAKHMSLESAAELVGKVIEGNTGILNRAGFAIDANATATEALAQVQQAVAGQAEASATTYARMREELSNVTDAIGGAVGGFAPLLAMLPGVSSGFTLAGSAIGALAPNLTKASAATGLLNLAMGPAGIVAAAGLAAVALYESAEAADKAHFSFDEATSSIEGTSQAIGALIQAGAPQGAVNSLREYASAWDDVKLAAGKADSDLQALYENQAVAQNVVATLTNYTKNTTLDLTDAQIEDGKRLLADAQAQVDAIELQIAAKERLVLTDKEAIQTSKDIAAITDDFAQSNYPALLERLNQILADGTTTSKEKAAAIHALAEEEESYGLSIAQTTARLDEQTIAENSRAAGRKTAEEDMTRAAIAERKYAEALHATAIMRSVLDGQEARSIQHDYEGDAEKIKAYKEQIILNADAQNRWRPQIAAADQALDLQKARLEAAADAAKGYAESLLGASSFASKIRPVDINVRGGDKVTGTAAELQKTQSILGSVLGTFKQLDSLSQASEEADSIATNLIGEPGELATIDRLLKQGRISQDEYTAAIQAGNRISKESGAIENDLNTIRAKQLPLLADADRQYGNLIDSISHMSAEQATATLGFMDSTESMKAQNAVAVAAAAAQADVGSAARESATAIIEGAVAADPVLEGMLTKIGLVARDHEGNLVINFDNADSLNESTDALTEAINNLTAAITGVPVIDVKETGAEETTVKLQGVMHAAEDVPTGTNTDITETGSDSTRSAMFGVTSAVNSIPESHNTTINADGNALGVIESVRSGLAFLQNASATTYINTVYTTSGTPPPAAPPKGRDGGIFNFVSGGMVQLAEAGPELLRFPTGGMAMAMSRGLYAVPDASLVYNAPATKEKMGGAGGQTFNFTFNGDISGPNEVMEAIKIAAREHFAGYRS